ncbi:MAG: hypothetical protein ACREQI_09700 [Candidatus Binataceae bacterium]
MRPADELRVAVVGATGAVGTQLVELIAARGFPHRELKLFAGETGTAAALEAGGESRLVETLSAPGDLSDFDIAFLALPAPRAAEIVSARPGPILIDLSAANRVPDSKVPIFAPGLTPNAEIELLRTATVVAPPHPAAHAIAACLKALDAHDGFAAVTVMLGASAGGKGTLTAVVEQTTDLLSARLDLEAGEAQRGFNIFMREHERSLAATIATQAAALLERSPRLSVQVAAVPIPHGCGLTIDLPWNANGAGARDRLRAAPGLLLSDEGEPLGTLDAAGEEAIFVSAEERPGALSLWCVFDNSRLAALDALWIAERIAASSPPG